MAEHDQRFTSYQQWVGKASCWLTRHPEYSDKAGFVFRAICFDKKGRLCRIGADFMRARDEDAFPVYWLWPDQIAGIAPLVDAAENVVISFDMGWDIDGAVNAMRTELEKVPFSCIKDADEALKQVSAE